MKDIKLMVSAFLVAIIVGTLLTAGIRVVSSQSYEIGDECGFATKADGSSFIRRVTSDGCVTTTEPLILESNGSSEYCRINTSPPIPTVSPTAAPTVSPTIEKPVTRQPYYDYYESDSYDPVPTATPEPTPTPIKLTCTTISIYRPAKLESGWSTWGHVETFERCE